MERSYLLTAFELYHVDDGRMKKTMYSEIPSTQKSPDKLCQCITCVKQDYIMGFTHSAGLFLLL